MSLVDTLKKEHAAIQALFIEVQSLGISSQEGRDKLIQGKQLLLSHLRKEDSGLYPMLEKLEETKAISNSFQTEMTAISKVVLEFFAKYEEGVDTRKEFATDFGKLIGALKSRIRKEESILYPAFEKYIDG